MRRSNLSGGLAVAALLLAVSPAQAHDVAAWGKEREGLFAAFKVKQGRQAAQIADIKAKTAALVAVAPNIDTVDQPPIVWQVTDKPFVVFDVPVGPRLVVVPAGEFTMGSPAGEADRARSDRRQRRVRLAAPLAVTMFPITYGEWSWFANETHRKPPKACVTLEGGSFKARGDRDWDRPGFAQIPRNPASCIGYDDAAAYAAWLSAKSGFTYRLLTEAEYEYVNRGGTTTAYWWGDDGNAGCTVANGFDADAQANAPALKASTCRDGHPFIASLEASKPNGFGLFDTAGNVASWTGDCWSERYSPAAGNRGDCGTHVLRGGSWASPPADLRAAARRPGTRGDVAAYNGFRLARVL